MTNSDEFGIFKGMICVAAIYFAIAFFYLLSVFLP